jgi:anti-sigma B factor antagonist
MQSGEAGFWIDVERQSDDRAVVAMTGDADLYSAPVLRERLTTVIDDGASHVILDLSDTTFLDSMALGVLLRAKKRLALQGGRLDVVVTRPDVRRIFEITMLDRVFELHSSSTAVTERSDEAG